MVNGWQLARMYNVDTDASFVYNENGLRVQKTVNGVVTKYTLSGKNVVHMTQGSNELHFFYDAQNKPAVVVYNGVPYSYVKNLQGDIVAVLDSSRNVVVSYVYDAWGRPISKTGSMASTLGTVQPFRYRGYVYDEEMDIHYLRNRYYNPNWCRFVNSDIIINRNVYQYCLNTPIGRNDESGCESENVDGKRDLTRRIDWALYSDVIECDAHIVGNHTTPSIKEMRDHYEDYRWFISKVSHKQKWDLKNDDSWQRLFHSSYMPSAEETFIYRGELITREDLGNIVYGYLGTAMGCSPKVLYVGGGVAKNVDDFSLENAVEIIDAICEASNDPLYYGDDPNDHYYITLGIQYYWDDYRKGKFEP